MDDRYPRRIICMTEEPTEVLYALGARGPDRGHLRLHRAPAPGTARKTPGVGIHQRQDRSHSGTEAGLRDRLFRYSGRYRAGVDQARHRGLDQQSSLGRWNIGVRTPARCPGGGRRTGRALCTRARSPYRRVCARPRPGCRGVRGSISRNGTSRSSPAYAGSASWSALPAATMCSRSAPSAPWPRTASSATPARSSAAPRTIIFGSWCGKRFRPNQVIARSGWDAVPAVRDGELHEIKSPLILQPGPAALTDGLDAIHHVVRQWSTHH